MIKPNEVMELSSTSNIGTLKITGLALKLTLLTPTRRKLDRTHLHRLGKMFFWLIQLKNLLNQKNKIFTVKHSSYIQKLWQTFHQQRANHLVINHIKWLSGTGVAKALLFIVRELEIGLKPLGQLLSYNYKGIYPNHIQISLQQIEK